MQLSERLQAVVNLITKGAKVADIGCDHAYLSIYMVEEKLASKVIAMDVNKGPLERAKENIKQYHFENQIETRLSDGLMALEPGEVDTLLIAGMGGALMQRILTGKKEVLEQVKELVLQPQSEIREMRFFLEEIGFRIMKEDMVIDAGKYYVILKARREDNFPKIEKEVYYRYGEYLLTNKHVILEKYLNREYDTLKQICQKLGEHPSLENEKRKKVVQEDMEYCREGLAYYGNM
ncbi:MAG: SAM-dependent methyltransferase [Lachnospiraceae bacterium]|nr:SAM-dependent methyltransferase [Lachnospiraceae bacterium]